MLRNFLFVISSLWAFPALSQPMASRFVAQTIDDKVVIGYGLALGDVDGDGKTDILLADKKQFVWYRNGDWKRFVLIDSLTRYDNVCIAARDINGDGKVEIAVGAQWNPGESIDTALSGAVHFLVRPSDPTGRWKAVALHHEPTVHRMHWVRFAGGEYRLVVVPLHGRGNKAGSGEGARILAYHFPQNGQGVWRIDTLEKTMHLTHNFDVVENRDSVVLYLGGKEGIGRINLSTGNRQQLPTGEQGVGEVRVAKTRSQNGFITTIEPMHGNELVVYPGSRHERVVVDDNLREGHALAVGDLLQTGSPQIVAGWRAANKEGKVGIKLYIPKDAKFRQWKSTWIDENAIACEDLKIVDLDCDGKLDIVACGRATKPKNLLEPVSNTLSG
jgi:hypothetical protein